MPCCAVRILGRHIGAVLSVDEEALQALLAGEQNSGAAQAAAAAAGLVRERIRTGVANPLGSDHTALTQDPAVV